MFPETPPAEEWQTEWFGVLPEVEELARRRKTPAEVLVMRSSQLDAAKLDVELTTLLREQFERIFSLFNQRLITSLQPEMTLLLDFLIFRFSVWLGRPTPGLALMNLRYRDERRLVPDPQSPAASSGEAGAKAARSQGPEVAGHTGVDGPGLDRRQRALYGLMTVLGRYVWARLDQLAAARHWGDLAEGTWGSTAWRAMRWAENAFKVASLANFVIFLRHGKYRTLVERLLRARLVYSKPYMQHAQSFEYLNRQLVWTELSQFMLFVLPLVDAAKLRRYVFSRLPRISAAPGQTAGGGGKATAQSEASEPCAICGSAQVVVPYSALPCQHRFCYYCLRAQCQEDPAFACPRCATRVAAMRRWRSPSSSVIG